MSNDPRHVVTGVARLSYVYLTRPRAAQNPGDAKKYSVTLLIPKTDTKTKAAIDAAIEAAKQAGISKKWPSVPAYLNTPVGDGDGLKPKGQPYGDECKGCWVINASNTRRPPIVDTQLQTILDETEIYSGMYARCGIDLFAYNNNGNKGIGCSLATVQKLHDGEPLTSRASAEDDFALPVTGAAGFGAAAANPFA